MGEGECVLRADRAGGNLVERPDRVEVRQAHADAEEIRQPLVDIRLSNKALVEGTLGVLLHKSTAVNVGASSENVAHGLLSRHGVVMLIEDVVVGVTVRGDVTVKVPFLARNSGQEPVVGTRRDAVDGVVTAHKAGDTTLLDACLKWKHVRVNQVLHRDLRVEFMAIVVDSVNGGIFHGVGDVVLATGACLDMSGVLRGLLETLDKVRGIFTGEIRVLSGRLDVTSPARLTGKIDDRGPKSRVAIAGIHERACLATNL
mmetsp:Transcript_20400/g.47704  ORF Transcript_20400/g.47704 Transcript_20400/m.47704 type:complete len:258 (+) Transcript_20400:1223-1996(+)